MRRLLFALSLAATPVSVFAALCSVAAPGVPCMPDPGPATRDSKAKILTAIKEAQELEPAVLELKATYIAIRATAASDEAKLSAAQAYLAAYTTQEQTYQKAMTLTADLYHVKPRHDAPFEIQTPSEPQDAYVAGLTARWNPRVTESGRGISLSVKIDGADGRSHYSGATAMNPRTPGGRMAITTADGRVLVLKGTFAMALERGNPGYLARALYHESRHFDRLSWVDGKGQPRGWQNIDKEERDAYKRDLDHIKAFDLKTSDADEIRQNYIDYANAVRTGVPLTDNTLTPKQEADWKNHYENIQVNIEEEFTRLSEKVAAERTRQEEMAEKQRQARENRERQERLEKERRQEAERNEELARLERKKRAFREEMDTEAAACGYRITYDTDNETMLGFSYYGGQFILGRHHVPFDFGDLKVVFLMTRTCQEIESPSHPPPPTACNGAASLLHERVGRGDFGPKLRYLTATMGFTYSDMSECIQELLATADSITDTKSFDKAASAYQKRLSKRLAQEAKRDRDREREERERQGRDRKREERDRSPANGRAPDCRRNDDPFGCQPRHP